MHRLDESAEILQLSDFDRLVYVISFIEHYPARDCATLLGRPPQDVVVARNRAVDRVTAFKQKWRRASRQLPTYLCPPPCEKTFRVDGSCGSLPA